MRPYLLLLASLLLLACSKDKDDPAEAPAKPPEHACGVVEGITRTDPNGALMLPPDTTDWRVFEDWCAGVEALFADRPAVVAATGQPDSLMIACWPNPNSGSFMMGFFRDDASYVDIRFVNEDFELVWALDSITARQVLLRTDSVEGITPPQLIRAYYRVVHLDGSAHRGHGDVLVEP